MLKQDKILIGAIIGVFVLALLTITLRSNEIWPMGYEKVSLSDNYVKATCFRFGKPKKEITDESELKELLSNLEGVEVRDADWYDNVKSKIENAPVESSKYMVILEDESGKETVILVSSKLCKGANVDYIASLCNNN